MQLGYNEEIYINKITIYDTVCGTSSVSKVSVLNHQDHVYVTVFTQEANCNNVPVAYALELEFPVK